MPTSYAQKQSAAQKKEASSTASVLDSSSQGESLQRHADMANNAAQREEIPRPNNTGMPDNLKAGIESLSGFSMDDVRVHYNSSKPATVQALAYTQGTDIHVAPGQEKCLPHEAWHVAQQMAGRVSPTTNINGMPVNDNAALEHEADVMGARAVQCKENAEIGSKKISIQAISVQRFPTCPSGYSVIPKGGAWENGCTIRRDDIVSSEILDSKVKALQAISVEAASIGEATRTAMNDDDTFYAIIPAKYKTRNGNEVALDLKYDFRSVGVDVNAGEVGGPGYIVEVSKSKKRGGERKAEMINGFSTADGVYSNAHETPSGSVLNNTYNKINGITKVKSFKGSVPDAYTKLAGEGARFQCVRRNMKWINDETVFYKPKGNPKKKGVKFSELWLTWSASFGKAYNIDDGEIVQQMGSGNTLFINKRDGVITTECEGLPGNCVPLDGNSTVISGYVEETKEKMSKLGYKFNEKSQKWEHSSGFFIEIAVPEFKAMKKILGTGGDGSNEIKIQLLKSFLNTYKINVQIPNDYHFKLAIYELITQKGIPLDLKKKALTEVGKIKNEQTLNEKKGKSKEEIEIAKRVMHNKMIVTLWTPVLKSNELQKDVMGNLYKMLTYGEIAVKEFIKDRIIEFIENSKKKQISVKNFREKFVGKFSNNENVLSVYYKMLTNNALTIKYGFDDDDRPTVVQPLIAKGTNVAFTFLTA